MATNKELEQQVKQMRAGIEQDKLEREKERKELAELKKLVTPSEFQKEALSKELEAYTVGVHLFRYQEDQPYKVVTSWKTLRNYVHTVKNVGISEDQAIEITLEDGEKVELSLQDFNSLLKTERVRIDMKKSTFVTDRLPDGTYSNRLDKAVFTYNDKEYSISAIFLN